MKPGISVIIPNFNRAHTIARAIDSVLSQTLPALEIIVVDDGSSDNSRQFIKDCYPSVHLITQNNMGVSSARNRGIDEAAGEWIAFLDSDDSWLPEKLESQSNAILENSSYKVVHTNETWMRNGKILKQKKKHRKYGGDIFQRCLPLCVISPSSIMIHRDVFDDVGCFNEDLPVCEDYELWLRICSRYPVFFLQETLIIKHGGHDDQLSRQYWGMDRYRIRILASILSSNYLKPDDRRAAVLTLLEKINIFLEGAKKHRNSQFNNEFESLRENYLNELDLGSQLAEEVSM